MQAILESGAGGRRSYQQNPRPYQLVAQYPRIPFTSLPTLQAAVLDRSGGASNRRCIAGKSVHWVCPHPPLSRLAVLGPSCLHCNEGLEGGMGSKAWVPSPGPGLSPPPNPTHNGVAGIAEVRLGPYEVWKPQKVGVCAWERCPRNCDLSHVAQGTVKSRFGPTRAQNGVWVGKMAQYG